MILAPPGSIEGRPGRGVGTSGRVGEGRGAGLAGPAGPPPLGLSLFQRFPGSAGDTTGKAGFLPSQPEKQALQQIDVKPGRMQIEVAKGGAWLKLRGEKRPGKAPQVGRGKIQGQTDKVRKAQLDYVQQLDRSKIKHTLFATLTLRSSDDLQAAWHHLETSRRKWFKRLERHLQGFRWFAIWRKEPHKSGMPHLHVLIFFLDDAPHLVGDFRPWNDRAWAECAGDPSLERTGCNTKLMRAWGGVVYYCAKYLAKASPRLEGIYTGKVWDVVHRDVVKAAGVRDLEHHDVAKPVGVLVGRIARRWHQRKAACWQVQSVREDGTKFWRRLRDGRIDQQPYAAQDKAAWFQELGVRVRRHRPRLSHTRVMPMWVADEQGKLEPAPVGMPGTKTMFQDECGQWLPEECRPFCLRPGEATAVEVHSFFTSSYYLPEVEARRVLAWARNEHDDRLAIEASLPF
jgi:hypothetical protein